MSRIPDFTQLAFAETKTAEPAAGGSDHFAR